MKYKWSPFWYVLPAHQRIIGRDETATMEPSTETRKPLTRTIRKRKIRQRKTTHDDPSVD